MVPIGKGSRQGPTQRLYVPMRGRSTRQRFPGDFPLHTATPSAQAHCTSILSMLIKAQQSLAGITRTPGCLFSPGARDHFPVAAHVKYHTRLHIFLHTGQYPPLPRHCWPCAAAMPQCMSWWKIGANSPNNHTDIKKNNCKQHFRARHKLLAYAASLPFLPVLGG